MCSTRGKELFYFYTVFKKINRYLVFFIYSDCRLGCNAESYIVLYLWKNISTFHV